MGGTTAPQEEQTTQQLWKHMKPETWTTCGHTHVGGLGASNTSGKSQQNNNYGQQIVNYTW